jgi:hypothetical protein
MKMETGRNFSMLGINSGHHNLPTYGMSLKSDIVEFVQYCGGHFENLLSLPNNVWRLIVFAPFLIIITSTRLLSGDVLLS